MREARPSRRAVLASAGALALAGCVGSTDEPAPRPDPDLRLRDRVAAEIDGLVGAYAAATEAFPGLTDRLAPLAAEHQAHVTALRGPVPSSSPTTGTSTPPPATAVPGSGVATVRWLAGLERRAARRRARQTATAGPDLARLLAAVGACESVHAVLLGDPA
jgi:hypothetical protein